MKLRMAAWLLLFGIAAVTLVPPDLRPSTGLPLKLERFLAFAILAGAFAMAYPRRPLLIVFLACLGAISLELMQLLVPGRDASPIDALVKVLGAVSGTVGAVIIRGFARRLWPSESD